MRVWDCGAQTISVRGQKTKNVKIMEEKRFA